MIREKIILHLKLILSDTLLKHYKYLDNMNDIERSIIQEKKTVGKIVWKHFRKTGKLEYFNEKGEMTGDSKILPIFPEYHMGGTQRTLKVESYVRKQFKGRWYLIPVITQWESPTPMFGPDVVKDVIKRQQIEAYKVLLYYRYAKPMVDAFGCKLNTQLLDVNQEDERTRLGLFIEKKKSLSDYTRSLWIKYIRGI